MNLKQRILQRLGALMLASILCLNLNAQHAAVKTNLLYDATLTPNLGVELGLGRKSTMQVLYSLNLWKHPLNNDKMWKHWQLLGEYRWWPCSKFNGHFIGVHAMGGEFDMQKVRFKLPFTTGLPTCATNATRPGTPGVALPTAINGYWAGTGTSRHRSAWAISTSATSVTLVPNAAPPRRADTSTTSAPTNWRSA